LIAAPDFDDRHRIDWRWRLGDNADDELGSKAEDEFGQAAGRKNAGARQTAAGESEKGSGRKLWVDA
jgi:hypothetical protein